MNHYEIKRKKNNKNIKIITIIGILLIIGLFIGIPLILEKNGQQFNYLWLFIAPLIGIIILIIAIAKSKKAQNEFDNNVINNIVSKYLENFNYANYEVQTSDFVDKAFSNKVHEGKLGNIITTNECFTADCYNVHFAFNIFKIEKAPFYNGASFAPNKTLFTGTLISFKSNKAFNGLIEIWTKDFFDSSIASPIEFQHKAIKDDKYVLINTENDYISEEIIAFFEKLALKYEKIAIILKDDMIYFLLKGNNIYFYTNANDKNIDYRELEERFKEISNQVKDMVKDFVMIFDCK